MLNSETKKKIFDLRDTLVGKIPTPTGQVEQITLALIYKFMSDIDEKNAELGDGQSQFFAGDYKKYSWKHILDKSLSGDERVHLYAEALEKMPRNPHVPQLFRDIFRNAFLPFRDPQTLYSFLKQVNDFHYDHSEDLGDAFEYLLSVMGSQGDAGQFRTPRHIIDFMVEVVDPQKTDRILDPACGTAGFLISAYKHILKKNMKEGSDKPGSMLSYDDKKKLTENFVGYDISHDMVRLSMVNMYLHGFPNPHIYEYDSLTSEEKWDDDFDCILANPPFMTPKGGIQPHKRFAIHANRSEVLFVDYITEHLSTHGKAGIIVPEGIIFQSANAYKALRKMLIEDGYLWAVASLPSGVFQPYSGVKTSILFLDKTIAKKTDSILFVKVENDGFDLGAQRKVTTGTDLPMAIESLVAYKQHLLSAQTIIKDWPSIAEVDGNPLCNVILKEEIIKSDYNLSGDRYKYGEEIVNQKWPMVELDKLCTLRRGLTYSTQELARGDNGTPFYNLKSIKKENIGQKNDFKYFIGEIKEQFFVKKDDLLIALTDLTPTSALIGSPKIIVNNIRAAYSADLAKIIFHNDRIIAPYLYYLLRSDHYRRYIIAFSHGANVKHLQVEGFYKYKIPLPPIEVQKKIVEEFDSYQRIIDGARQVIESWKPNINFKSDWKNKKVEELAYINKKTIDPSKEYGQKLFPYVDIAAVGNGTGEISYENKIKGVDAPSRARRVIEDGDVLISTVRPNLQAFAYITNPPKNSLASTGFAVLTPKTDQIDGQFLFYAAGTPSIVDQMITKMGRGAYPSINQNDIETLSIPIPPLQKQQQIVSEIEKEKASIDANKRLIKIFEKKIKDKIAEVCGEESSS